METRKSPAKPIAEILLKSPLSSPSYTKAPHKSLFSRTFGKYISRSAGHFQPRHLDFTELLRLDEELRDRESRLKTELVDHKLLKESLAIVPVLETEIYRKETELERTLVRIERLKTENERLKKELEEVRWMTEEEKRNSLEMMKVMEDEIMQLKKTESDHLHVNPKLDDEESSDSRKIQRLMEVSVKSNLISHFKERNECINKVKNNEDQELNAICANNGADIERPDYSECNSEELAESALFNLISDRSTNPKSPKIRQSTSSIISKLQFPPAPPPAVPVKPVSQPPPPLSNSVPPPPPPPPPSKEKRSIWPKVRRVPELVEFYHSLMRKDSRKDCTSAVIDIPTGANSRDMIGEIENRSAYLLAVDERAVLKHFEWPEQKADALREAAFGYSDLKKLALEASSFDDGRQPRDITLKKMQALFEKLEHGVYNLCRMRESATKRYRVFHIPMDWMLDTGIVSQFAGGFDMEAITAFQELREKFRFCQSQKQKAVGCSTADL